MILVTGATGTVGTELVARLLGVGARVRVGLRSPQKGAALVEQGAEVVAFDFAQPQTYGPALAGVSKVFFLSPPSAFDSILETQFVAAMKAAQVQHVVKLSVWNADGRGYTFARWHRESELLIEQAGIPFTHLRPSGFMQNFLQLAQSVTQSGIIALPLADAAVGYIDVRDIAAVAAQVLLFGDHAGRAYNLSGPEALSYGQIAQQLTELTGRPVQYISVPSDRYAATLASYGVPAPIVAAICDLYAYYANGGSDAVSPHVAEILGRPASSVARFLREHKAAFTAPAAGEAR